MHLNVTFLIQIGNFWITYFILHRLLLSPFVKAIEKKKVAQAMLAARLKDKESLIHTLQESKVRNLEDFRRYIKETYTPPAPDNIIEESLTEPLHHLNNADLKQLAQKIEATIIEKAPHVV